jgi:hypothetical protein
LYSSSLLIPNFIFIKLLPAGKNNPNNKAFQLWKQDYHPIELDTVEKMQQRLDNLHEKPVRSGLVWKPWHFKYSSAIDYYTNDKD